MDHQERWLGDWADKDLVVAYKGGVPEAYDEMYRRYSARVQATCKRMLGSTEDAREATQETFLKAYQALPRFNGQYKLGAWLSRIATNVCLDQLRKRARSAAVTSLNETHELVGLELGPEDVVVRDAPAMRALDDIQPLHARALELRNLEGMSHVEIAEQLKMSPMQVKALLHRARSSFRRAWDNASGWALAPLAGIRSFLHHGRDAGFSSQLPVWTQAATPLMVERVAASAMVVVVALSGGTGVTPTIGSDEPTRVPVASAGIARAHNDGVTDEVPSAVNERPAATTDAVEELLAVVQDTAQAHSQSDPEEKDKDKDEHQDVGPGTPDHASQKLVEEVHDAAQEIQDSLPDR